MIRLLTAFLLLLAMPATFAEVFTTIPLSPQASVSPYNHVNQVAISTTEVGVIFTFPVTGYLSYVQVSSPIAWTYRGTQGSSTDAQPIAAGQTLTLAVWPIGFTFYAVGSGAGTLYVMPLSFGRPGP